MSNDSDSDDGRPRRSWAIMPPGKSYDELSEPVKQALGSIQIGSQFATKSAYTAEELANDSSSDESSSSSDDSETSRERRRRLLKKQQDKGAALPTVKAAKFTMTRRASTGNYGDTSQQQQQQSQEDSTEVSLDLHADVATAAKVIETKPAPTVATSVPVKSNNVVERMSNSHPTISLDKNDPPESEDKKKKKSSKSEKKSKSSKPEKKPKKEKEKKPKKEKKDKKKSSRDKGDDATAASAAEKSMTLPEEPPPPVKQPRNNNDKSSETSNNNSASSLVKQRIQEREQALTKTQKKEKARNQLELNTPYPGQPKKSRDQLLQEKINRKKAEKEAGFGVMPPSKKKRSDTPPRAPHDVFARRMPRVDHKTYKAPAFPKSKEEEKNIVNALEKVIPIHSLPQKNVTKLVAAFELKGFEQGKEIVTETMPQKPQRSLSTESGNSSTQGADWATTAQEMGEEFFYVVEDGTVSVEVDGEEVAQAKKGDTVGDSNLYHSGDTATHKRQKSIFRAKTRASLYRIDQKTYRTILQTERSSSDADKQELLEKIKMFENMTAENRKKLAFALKPLPFQKGDVLVKKKEFGKLFVVVSSGELLCRGGTDAAREGVVGENQAKKLSVDRHLVRGGYLSEDTLLPVGECITHDPEREVVAETNGLAYQVDRQTFEQVIGKPKDCLLPPEEVIRMQRLNVLRKNPAKELSLEEMAALQSMTIERIYSAGENIIEAPENEEEEIPAALYFVRQGTVKVKTGRFHKLKIAGGVFGEDMFEYAKAQDSTTACVKHAAQAKEDCVVGILTMQAYLEAFLEKPKSPEDMQMAMIREESSSRSMVVSARSLQQDSTRSIKTDQESSVDESPGKGAAAAAKESGSAPTNVSVKPTPKKKKKSRQRMPSLDESIHGPVRDYKFEDLKRLVMLGEGQFGQVWLAYDTKEKERKAYALKIQSKFELVDMAQAEICIREKEIMSRLNHPMIMKLFATFHDEQFLYMLLDMVNGGELFNRIYPMDEDEESEYESDYDSDEELEDGLPERDAKFYTFVLADILKYMHQKKYVYRDLKPENVLMGSNGYPILIDFGFTKKLTDGKTFTLCGTPAYLAPEMVLSLGHSFSVDHWALGIMVHEMLFKESFFFIEGMDPVTLYKSIAEDKFTRPTGRCSEEGCDFLEGLLQKDPVYRLGSLAGGENDILQHPWFDELEGNSFMIRKAQLKAPWIPDVKNPFDTQHFENWEDVEDKTSTKYPPLSEKEAEIFEDF